jgi:ABC-type microcin C transport system permease subunit YejE
LTISLVISRLQSGHDLERLGSQGEAVGAPAEGTAGTADHRESRRGAAHVCLDAARALGARRLSIMFRHILPNLFGTLLVYGTLRISVAILTESGLSYLGLGAQPPEPTWGNMLSDGQEYLLFYSWLPLFPGLAILLTVLGFNFLGDGLRDLLDPQLKDA